MRKRSLGITLTEGIIAATLAVLLGFLMLKLIGSGLGAHKKGAESRDAESGVRNVLGMLVSELRSAAVPPLSEPLVVTPVFWPGAWGAEQETVESDDFYLREEAESDGIEFDVATNRVVYVRMTETEPEPGDGPLDSFAVVELVVPEDNPSVIERRVYPLLALSGPLVKQKVTGADGGQRDGWLLDLEYLASHAPTDDRDVLFDAGKNARIAFKVSHRTFQPASDPGRTRYPQIFDPGVFRVEVAMAVGADGEQAYSSAWPRGSDWSTLREETTELKIPSVRQN